MVLEGIDLKGENCWLCQHSLFGGIITTRCFASGRPAHFAHVACAQEYFKRGGAHICATCRAPLDPTRVYNISADQQEGKYIDAPLTRMASDTCDVSLTFVDTCRLVVGVVSFVAIVFFSMLYSLVWREPIAMTIGGIKICLSSPTRPHAMHHRS